MEKTARTRGNGTRAGMHGWGREGARSNGAMRRSAGVRDGARVTAVGRDVPIAPPG